MEKKEEKINIQNIAQSEILTSVIVRRVPNVCQPLQWRPYFGTYGFSVALKCQSKISCGSFRDPFVSTENEDRVFRENIRSDTLHKVITEYLQNCCLQM